MYLRPTLLRIDPLLSNTAESPCILCVNWISLGGLRMFPRFIKKAEGRVKLFYRPFSLNRPKNGYSIRLSVNCKL